MTGTYMTILLCLYSLGMSTPVVFHHVNTIERSTQVDAPRMGRAVIHAKAKPGEMLKAVPKEKSKFDSQRGSPKNHVNPAPRYHKADIPPGANQISQYAWQKFAQNRRLISKYGGIFGGM